MAPPPSAIGATGRGARTEKPRLFQKGRAPIDWTESNFMVSSELSHRRVVFMTGRYIMRLLLKVIALTMITSFPFSTNAGTYLDLQRALVFKQHGQYGKAYPILLQLAEDEFVRAQMELADMYVMGQGIMKNNDEAIYWACRAAQSGEYRALKFRIKLALRTTSDSYQPRQCSQIMN